MAGNLAVPNLYLSVYVMENKAVSYGPVAGLGAVFGGLADLSRG